MELNVTYLLFIISGIVAGGIITWLILRPELARLRRELQIEIERRSAAEAKLAEIPKLEGIVRDGNRAIATFNDERKEQGERIRELETRIEAFTEMETKMSTVFRAAATQALSANNSQFLDLAEQKFKTIQGEARGELEKRKEAIKGLVEPLGKALQSVDEYTRELEKARTAAYSGLAKEISNLGQASTDLRTEAAKLARALSSPGVRGRWGEIQLQRILELAGMTEYCDHVPQETVTSEGVVGRPDRIVNFPNAWRVAVDSKVPYDAFVEAIAATDESTRESKLREHAKAVRGFVDRLSNKAYWKAINSPDYVIMLIPGESFFYAALEQDPKLLEYGAEQKVLIVSPIALIGLLRSIAFGWREEKLARNAEQIRDLGIKLYDHMGIFVNHFIRISSGLQTAVNAYEDASKSLKGRLLVTTQKFKALGVTAKDDIPIPKEIEVPSLLSKFEDITPIVELPESETEIGAAANGR